MSSEQAIDLYMRGSLVVPSSSSTHSLPVCATPDGSLAVASNAVDNSLESNPMSIVMLVHPPDGKSNSDMEMDSRCPS